MNFLPTDIPGVVLIEPRIIEDARGFFLEVFHAGRFREAGIEARFVQDNHSCSRYGTLRGLHYQNPRPQGKLVRVVRGEVYDVVVDLRRDAATFGRWMGLCLSEANRRQLYVPAGLAHGFCVTSQTAEVLYKCSDFYCPEYEHVLRWDDPELVIAWPIGDPILSEKDQRGLPFAESAYFEGAIGGQKSLRPR